MKSNKITNILGALALGAASLTGISAAQAQERVATVNLEAMFDTTLGTEQRAPRDFTAGYDSPFERHIAAIADGQDGRIGVAAVDLASGQQISILGDQSFPMASTSKIAIAATFMEGVEQGRWSLNSRFPLMIPVRSRAFSSDVAPVTRGQSMAASELIEIMITRSSNPATDALLAAVGGPAKVNDWARRAGLDGFNLTRDIATLVRDDGEIDPAKAVDIRDSATPATMTKLLAGLYQGRWLNASSRRVILGAMERCRTGKRRIPALLPASAQVKHKTGSLNNTSSDIGIIHTPDGRAIALAIYVTGQGSRPARESKIAEIAKAIYDGYTKPDGRNWVTAAY